MDRRVRSVGMALAAWALTVGPVAAQDVAWDRSGEGRCEDSWGDRDRDRYCETLSASMAAPSMLAVDGGMNGGVEVVGWSWDVVEVEARVWATAESEGRALELAREVRLRVDGGRLSADGPRTERRENWGVSWTLRVPRTMDLDLETHNGGISVDGVSGDIRFDAMNGGVRLAEVGGDVKGRTTNGGLHIELAGTRWSGAGLDAETTNGGVRLYLPEGYSADLVTGTVNGGIDIDFPVMVRGRIGRRLETTLGEGGATIRAVTTNGGVRIQRTSGVPVR